MAQEEARYEQVRRWDGDVAGTGELDEVRAWVVWGEGRADDRAAEPERAEDLPGEPGNDIARQIAATNDPDWKPDASTSWIRVVEGDEQDVDGFVQDDESARGYAPYLMAPENTGEDTRMMGGVLRGDKVRRRKPGRMDTGRTS